MDHQIQIIVAAIEIILGGTYIWLVLFSKKYINPKVVLTYTTIMTVCFVITQSWIVAILYFAWTIQSAIVVGRQRMKNEIANEQMNKDRRTTRLG